MLSPFKANIEWVFRGSFYGAAFYAVFRKRILRIMVAAAAQKKNAIPIPPTTRRRRFFFSLPLQVKAPLLCMLGWGSYTFTLPFVYMTMEQEVLMPRARRAQWERAEAERQERLREERQVIEDMLSGRFRREAEEGGFESLRKKKENSEEDKQVPVDRTMSDPVVFQLFRAVAEVATFPYSYVAHYLSSENLAGSGFTPFLNPLTCIAYSGAYAGFQTACLLWVPRTKYVVQAAFLSSVCVSMWAVFEEMIAHLEDVVQEQNNNSLSDSQKIQEEDERGEVQNDLGT